MSSTYSEILEIGVAEGTRITLAWLTHVYQISAFHEVPRSQKIDFGEVAVHGLVKMGPKCEKMYIFSSYDAIGLVLGGMGVDTL